MPTMSLKSARNAGDQHRPPQPIIPMGLLIGPMMQIMGYRLIGKPPSPSGRVNTPQEPVSMGYRNLIMQTKKEHMKFEIDKKIIAKSKKDKTVMIGRIVDIEMIKTIVSYNTTRLSLLISIDGENFRSKIDSQDFDIEEVIELPTKLFAVIKINSSEFVYLGKGWMDHEGMPHSVADLNDCLRDKANYKMEVIFKGILKSPLTIWVD